MSKTRVGKVAFVNKIYLRYIFYIHKDLGESCFEVWITYRKNDIIGVNFENSICNDKAINTLSNSSQKAI